MVDTPQLWRSLVDADQNDPQTESNPYITQLATGELLVGWNSLNPVGAGGGFTELNQIGRFYDLEGNVLGNEMRLNVDLFLDDEILGTTAALPFGLSNSPDFLFGYVDVDAVSSTLLLERKGTDGNTTQTFEISTATAPFFYKDVSLAVSGNTSTMVSFIEDTSSTALGYDRVSFSLFNATANSFTAPRVLFQNDGNDDTVSGLDSAVLANGSYVVTASAANGSDGEIWFEQVAPGGAQGGVQKIASTVGDTDNDFDATTAALSGGGFVIAWTNVDSDDTDVMFQIFNASGTAVGAPRTVQSGTNDNQKQPVVVATDDGGFVIILDDDATNVIAAYHYNASGVQLGTQRVLASGSAALGSPDAVLLDDGRIAVTWARGTDDVESAIIDTRDAAQSGQYPGTVTVGTIGDDVITARGLAIGHQGNDVLRDGVPTADTLRGGAGNDLFVVLGVDANELVSGGSGIDTLTGANFADGTTFDLLTQKMISGGVRQNMLGIEVVIGSLADEVFLGSGNDDTMNGGAGDDRFEGRFGDDLLLGQSGNDTMNGGLGHDRLYGGGGADSLLGSAGADLIFGDDGNDRLFGNGFTDTVRGGGGNDYIAGQTGADLLYGDSGDDTLLGSEGVDTIDGGAGADFVNGGGGNDDLAGAGGADTIFGGGGFDTLAGGTDNDRLIGGAGGDVLLGGDGNDTMFSEGGNDTLIGGGGLDTMDGGSGIDSMVGGASNDRMSGAGGDDIMRGGDGADLLVGETGDDLLSGNNGNDLLLGSAGDDTLFGDGQADRLIGGDGNDLLFGGAGADRFIFETGFDDDRIADWQDGLDQLDFSRVDEISSLFEFRVHASQVGGDVLVSLSDGSSILIENATRANFTADDLIF